MSTLRVSDRALISDSSIAEGVAGTGGGGMDNWSLSRETRGRAFGAIVLNLRGPSFHTKPMKRGQMERQTLQVQSC